MGVEVKQDESLADMETIDVSAASLSFVISLALLLFESDLSLKFRSQDYLSDCQKSRVNHTFLLN